MITITPHINGRKIGEAHARNISGLADISDYDVVFCEYANPSTGPQNTTEGTFKGTFKITGHPRNQSAWALVREIAARITPPPAPTWTYSICPTCFATHRVQIPASTFGTADK